MEVSFNSSTIIENFQSIIGDLLKDYSSIRSKVYSQKCIEELKKIYLESSIFLTHSATGALDMIALMMGIKEGDEVILPSFTFVSTANAFVSLGATPVFVDIELDSFNIDLDQVESLISEKTKAIIVVHYAGHACNLTRLKNICEKNRIFLIEDAAMSFGNTYNGIPLGTIGDFGVISFDMTKQISSVQGGLLLVNNKSFIEHGDIVYNLGTNKHQFLQGEVNYYEWVGKGSKFQMNELCSAVLYYQLLNYKEVLDKRKNLSVLYYELLAEFVKTHQLNLTSPQYLSENFNTFYIILKNKIERDKLAIHLGKHGIETMFHYIPLHNSKMGKLYCKSELPNSTLISDCLLRLPLHFQLKDIEVCFIVDKIKEFWK